MVFQILTALEALGQLRIDGLLDDPGARKAHQRARLRQGNVAEGCEACGDAAGGGMRQEADIETAVLRKTLHRCGGLRHLHQAVNALLHPGAAAGGKDDQRQLMGIGIFHGAGHLLAHGPGHRAHEKAAVQYHNHHLGAVDSAATGNHGLPKTGFLLLRLDLLLIARELQRILTDQILVHLLKAALVQDQAQAIIGPDGAVAAADGADIEVIRPAAPHGPAIAFPAADEAGRQHHGLRRRQGILVGTMIQLPVLI